MNFSNEQLETLRAALQSIHDDWGALTTDERVLLNMITEYLNA